MYLASTEVLDVPAIEVAAPSTSRRFEYVDCARGLCLLWMMLAHILTLSSAGGSFIFAIHLPGWSTTNFVMLTGLALSLIAGKRGGRTWTKRALQILAVAVVSNAVFTLVKLKWNGTLTFSAFLSEPWTISAILLPSAALLFLSPWLETAVEMVGSVRLFILVSVFEILGGETLLLVSPVWKQNQIYTSLFEFDNPRFGFPLAILLLLGIWAYSAGAVLRSGKPAALGILAGVFLSSLLLFKSQPIPLIYFYRFGMTLAGAYALTLIPTAMPLRQLLSLLGRSSLLVFILHRVLLQGERLGLGLFPLEAQAPLMFFTTLTLCALACKIKERHRSVALALKKIGF